MSLYCMGLGGATLRPVHSKQTGAESFSKAGLTGYLCVDGRYFYVPVFRSFKYSYRKRRGHVEMSPV